jgi:hypothetical protein
MGTDRATSGGTYPHGHRSFVMACHNEIPVKVNAFVDEGIADLVEVLSEVPELVTMESCQGSSEHDAYVFFR